MLPEYSFLSDLELAEDDLICLLHVVMCQCLVHAIVFEFAFIEADAEARPVR